MHYQIPKVTVIKPSSFDIIFDGQGKNVTDIASSDTYSLAINASYFGWNSDGSYFPA